MADILENSHPIVLSRSGSVSPLLPPEARGQCRWTELAQKYGQHPYRFFKGSGKSGITPIPPPNLARFENRKALAQARHHEKCQRARLSTFATWELIDSGCWIDSNSKLSNLADSYPIHEIFKQENWVTGNIPLPYNLPGVYSGRDLILWDVISPSLRLASCLIQHTANSPWLDALLYGPHSQVELSQRSILGGLITAESFRQRPHHEFKADLQNGRAWNVLTDMAKHFTWAIGSADVDSQCEMNDGKTTRDIPAMGGGLLGVTTALWRMKQHDWKDFGQYNGVFVLMNLTMIAPLFDQMLEPSERLAQQTWLAVLLSHEVMHAIGIVRGMEYRGENQLFSGPGAVINKEWLKEPFFEDEDVAELGYSWEKSLKVFSLGRVHTIIKDRLRDGGGQLGLGLWLDSWPDWTSFNTALQFSLAGEVKPILQQRNMDRYGQGAVTIYWPLTTEFIENLNQSAYWKYQVDKYGKNALCPPQIVGRGVIKDELPRTESYTIYGRTYNEWVSVTGGIKDAPIVPDTGDPVDIWEIKQLVKERSMAIRAAARRQMFEIAQTKEDQDRIRRWQDWRRSNPVPRDFVYQDNLIESRLQLALREAELDQLEADIRASEQPSHDEQIADQLARNLLRDALRYTMQGGLDGEDARNAEKRCLGALKLSRNRFVQARAHIILGSLELTDDPVRHLMIGIDKFRAFGALQIPNTEGSWRNIISEAQNMITRYQKIEWEALRPRYYTQQAQIDQAAQLAFKNQQYDCAAICHRLLKSNYVAIVAQAHVLLARLRDTPDKTEHCELARPRLLRLVTEATEQAGLWTDLLDVINRIATPRPWFRSDTCIGAPMESQQWEWIRTAQRLVRNDGRFNEIDEGLAAFRALSDSSYPGIRAFCHLQLSTNARAGDFLYRRLEAWAVIEDLQVLRDTFSNDDRWTRLYVEAMQVLSGNVEDQWVQWAQGIPLDDVLNFVAGSNRDSGPDPSHDSEAMDID